MHSAIRTTNKDFILIIEAIDFIGRDKSIVARHPASQGPTFRFIVDSDIEGLEVGKTIKADIKKNKRYIFNKLTEVNMEIEGK